MPAFTPHWPKSSQCLLQDCSAVSIKSSTCYVFLRRLLFVLICFLSKHLETQIHIRKNQRFALHIANQPTAVMDSMPPRKPFPPHKTSARNHNIKKTTSKLSSALFLLRLSATPPATPPTFPRSIDPPAELQELVLAHALPNLSEPITARVHNTFKKQVMQLQQVNKFFKKNVRFMYFNDNVFKLVYRPDLPKEASSERLEDWAAYLALRQFRVPSPDFSKYVRRLEIHLSIPREANSATSVAYLLQICRGLRHLFVDNNQYRDAPLWQPRSTALVQMRVVLVVEACFGSQLRGVMSRLSQEAAILLHPSHRPTVVVQGLQSGCDGVCAPLIAGVVQPMVTLRP
jgi:hypothetical protein